MANAFASVSVWPAGPLAWITDEDPEAQKEPSGGEAAE